MAPTPFVLELPEPPSANRWWRHVGSKVLLSAAARAYKADVATRAMVARISTIPAPRPIRIDVVWYRGRRAGDLDKRLGVLLDALQGTAYDNDSQIVEIAARRVDAPGAARVTVTVGEVAS